MQILSKTLLESINEGIIVFDLNGKVLKANRSFYKMHGLEGAFEKDTTIHDSQNNFSLHDLEGNEIPFEQWPFFRALAGDFLKNEVYKASNLNNGNYFYGLFNTSVFTANDQKTRLILISLTDITRYIEAKQLVEDKERLLSAILNNSQDGIHVLNLEEGRYEFMSPSQSRLTGFPLNQLMFNLEEAATRLHPEDFDAVNRYLEKVVSDDPPENPVEYRWKIKSGEYRWFSDNRRAIFDNGKAVKVVGVSRDITEKKRYENELKDLNELLTNMLYMSAHDLKSPVVNMKLLLQLIDESKEGFLFYFQKLKKSIDQLESVIEGQSALINAQINNDVEFASIDLKEELDTVISYNQAKLDNCGGKCIYQIEDQIPFVYVKQYINSILSNLISNAIKYRDDSKSLKIKITAKRLNNGIKLTISDNGMGIDLDKNGHQLFKPFKRFNQKVKGTGIGLYLINNLVRKNGGHITVKSTLGKGTTFNCYLAEYVPSSVVGKVQCN